MFLPGILRFVNDSFVAEYFIIFKVILQSYLSQENLLKYVKYRAAKYGLERTSSVSYVHSFLPQFQTVDPPICRIPTSYAKRGSVLCTMIAAFRRTHKKFNFRAKSIPPDHYIIIR